MTIPQTILVIALSYMIGSIPTAYFVGKLNSINIFELGSGNMGTTNVLRTLGLFWGILVAVGDLGKGILAVWLARQIAPSEPLSTQASASVIAAVSVVIGHNWSFFASLLTGSIKGGKGAATAGGTWIILMPAVAIAVPFFILALVILATRYMSLGVMTASVVGSLVVVVLVLAGQLEPIYLFYILTTVFIIVRHRENIKRLLDGNERRLGERVQLPNK
jgi:acyl phosphate:glycerol-3-phosphate acyltransferase